MIMQVQTHLGATGLINTKYLAWKKKAAAERKWAPGKKYFRAAISDVEELNKLTTGKAELTDNAVFTNKNTEQQVHEEMAEKLGESFDTLAMAATAKKTTPSRSRSRQSASSPAATRRSPPPSRISPTN